MSQNPSTAVGQVSADGQFRWDGQQWVPIPKGTRESTPWTRPMQLAAAALLAVEAIFSVLAIHNNVAPPTLNLDDPSDGCDIDLVPHTAKQRKIDVALSNSFGFGGTNASLVLKRV